MKYTLVLSSCVLTSLSMAMPISDDQTEAVRNDEQYQINGNYAQVRIYGFWFDINDQHIFQIW